jgi:predicted nucleotidyltransferase/DNA-binding XRE family transcriptional regulator
LESFGEMIRRMREEKNLPLRKVAAYLDIDQAILSKMERGIRIPSKKIVVKLAKYFNEPEAEFIKYWLSEKVIYEIGDEKNHSEIFQLAEQKLSYRARKISGTPDKYLKTKRILKKYFQQGGLVSRAWIFGSFARKEDDENSDIDILIDVPVNQKFTLFDIAEIKYDLENLLSKRIDVVMLKGLRPAVKERIIPEMLLVYEA